MDEWRPVVGFESYYEVSNTGKVRRVGRRELAQVKMAPRGTIVCLCAPDRPRRSRAPVHRLVMAAFMGEEHKGKQVVWLDGDETNNSIENLALRRTVCVNCNARDDVQHGWCVTCRPAKQRRNFHRQEDRRRERLGATAEVCGICGEPETTLGRGGLLRRLTIDHDHESGQVRGVLCNKCNAGLGMFRDRPDLLREAADYIERCSQEAVA